MLHIYNVERLDEVVDNLKEKINETSKLRQETLSLYSQLVDQKNETIEMYSKLVDELRLQIEIRDRIIERLQNKELSDG